MTGLLIATVVLAAVLVVLAVERAAAKVVAELRAIAIAEAGERRAGGLDANVNARWHG